MSPKSAGSSRVTSKLDTGQCTFDPVCPTEAWPTMDEIDRYPVQIRTLVRIED